MPETHYIYEGQPFPDPGISPLCYRDEFFDLEIDLESDAFFDLRRRNDIRPYRLRDSSSQELDEIRDFFREHYAGFFFLFDQEMLIGSILLVRNYIQSLTIAPVFQRRGHGRRLSQFAVNHLFSKGYRCVELSVLEGNVPAHYLYSQLGFRVRENGKS